MEDELRHNLRSCAEAFARARGLEMSTVGRLAAGDWRFFDRLHDDRLTFTIRKYDDVLRWFAKNWPEGAEWPSHVRQPAAAGDAA